jgi:hypothetical protein
LIVLRTGNHSTGVNVMITILGYFGPFSKGKKLSYLKTNVVIFLSIAE